MINAYAAHEPKGELQKFEYDPGPLSGKEIEIDVDYCGICHSDLSMIDNEWGFSQYPLVPGHEVVGRVSQIGQAVSGFELGQVVGLGWHSGYCNSCELCDDGDHNLCSSAQPTIAAHHGGFAERVRADASSVVAIPEGVDLEAAGPLFCGGITVFNPLVQYEIKPTDKVAVIGIGGLGHMALMFLNAWGCEVTAFTSSEHKRKEALKLGAHKTLDSTNNSDLEKAAGQFDLILSTVNVKLDWNAYVGTLKAKGRLHFVGATLEPIDVSVPMLMGSQRSISSSPVGSPATIKKMLGFSALHKIKPVVEVIPMADVNKAIDKLRDGNVHYRIVLKR